MKRNRTIDFLKGLCVVLIITNHNAWTESERLRFLFPFWVDMAVPTLMILSGFLAAESFKRNGINSFSEAYNKDFLIRKILRLLVPFTIVFAVEVVLRSIIAPKSPLFFLLSFFAGGGGSGCYYTPIMTQFIFVFPIIFFSLKDIVLRGCCGASLQMLYMKLSRHHMVWEMTAIHYYCSGTRF